LSYIRSQRKLQNIASCLEPCRKQSFRELFLLLAIFCCTETDTVGNASFNDWEDIQAGEIMSLTREWGKFPTFEFKCCSYI